MLKQITTSILIIGFLTSTTAALTFVETFPNQEENSPLLPIAPVRIIDTRVSNPVFDPTDNQEAEISFSLSRAAYVTINILDQDRKIIRTLARDRYFLTGENTLDWDGQDKFGDIVYDDIYTYTIRAEIDDQTAQKDGEINVRRGYENQTNNIATPRLNRVYLAKDAYDPALEANYIVFTLTSEADVKGQIYDAQGREISEFINQKKLQPGHHKIKLNAAEIENETRQMSYQLKATNRKGDDQKSGIIKYEKEANDYSRKPNILSDHVKDHPYSPAKTQLPIHFKLDRDANITVEIRNGDFVVATVTTDTPLSAGSHTIYWNGRDKFGDIASDSVYQYKITAANFDGRNVEFGNFSIQDGNTTAFTGPNCAGFNDILASHPYCSAISWAKNNRIIQGYPDGTFRPNAPVKRVEALKMVLETLNVTTQNNQGLPINFKDTSRFAWYSDYLATALSLGVIQGYPDGTFRPENPVSNIESFVILLNTARSKDGIIIPTSNYGQPYFDTPNTPATQWYLSYAWYAKERSLSLSDNYLYPANYTTRAELAAILYRYRQAR